MRRVLRGMWARIKALVFRRALDREMDDELRFHIDMETDKNIARGMSAAEARRRAYVAFGGVERYRERLREGRQAPFIEPFLCDLRLAARSLRRDRSFSLVAILTIALGVGATASVFTLVNVFLIRPIPIAYNSRLVAVDELRVGAMSAGFEGPRIPFTRYRAYAERTKDVFDGLAARRFTTFAARIGDGTLPIDGAQTSANYFAVLGLTPAAGSFYSNEDDARVVISHRLWRDHFQSDPNIAGRVISLDGAPFAIAGVAPVGFTGASILWASDIWVPMAASADTLAPGQWSTWVAMFGRLRTGVDPRTAEAAAATVAVTVPPDERQTRVRGASVARMTGVPANFRGGVAAFLGVLLCLAALVLLIAASNMAGMLLARLVARRRELAVRLAIGSGRFALVRHLLTEGLLIFGLGGVGGVALAYVSTAWLTRSAVPGRIGFDVAVVPDGTVLAFALGTVLMVGLLFSLVPALQASQSDLVPALRNGGRLGPVSGGRIRRLFVVGQLAMATFLLVIAALFGRSVQGAVGADLGFDYGGTVVATINLAPHGYDQEREEAFFTQLVDELRGVPGVSAVGLSDHVFLDGAVSRNDVSNGLEGRDHRRTNTFLGVIDTAFFGTMHVGVVAGRTFNVRDADGSPEVTIVNETLAEQLWPGTSPLGQRLRMLDRELEVVGVTDAGRYTSMFEGAAPFAYLPFAQNSRSRMSVHVRAPGNEAAALAAIGEVVRRLDADVAVEKPRPMTEVVDVSLFPQRFTAGLVGVFGVVGLALSVLGVYGVVSFQVAQRTRELGIRRALGARATDLVFSVVRSGLMLAFCGSAIGVALGTGFARVLASVVAGLEPYDAVVLIAAPLLLTAASMASSALPGFRATRVPATRALSEE